MLTADIKNPDSNHDFGKDIIPEMLREGRNLYAYKFQGYWKMWERSIPFGKPTWIFWTRTTLWISATIPGRFIRKM